MILFGVLAVFWAWLIYHLGAQWSAYEQYNYGWSVPFLCAYLLWRRVASPPASSSDAPPQPSRSPGLWPAILLVFCALLYAPTRFLHEANPTWRLTSFLWTLAVIGLTLLALYQVLGPATAKRFAFPICFFVVSVPWPSAVENFFMQSLMRFNAASAVEFLGLAGIPAAQNGNVIEIHNGVVGIDEACSGIRSLQAALMLSLFFGECYRLSPVRRCLLLGGGFLLALIFNLARTLLLVSVASARGLEAMARWHDPAGVTILVGCFFGLWALSLLIRDRMPAPTSLPGTFQHLPAVRSLRVALALGLWFFVVEAGTELWYRSHELPSSANQQWAISVPGNEPAYKAVAIPKSVAEQFLYDHGLETEWLDPGGARWKLYYFQWLRGRGVNQRVKVHLAKTHGPEKCLPALGIRMKSDLGEAVVTLGDFQLTVHQYLFEAAGQKCHVFYGIYEDSTGSGVLANRRLSPSDRVQAALSGSRNYGQRYLEAAVWGYEQPDQAKAAFSRELEKLVHLETRRTDIVSVPAP